MGHSHHNLFNSLQSSYPKFIDALSELAGFEGCHGEIF
jgi:hypothetical protein